MARARSKAKRRRLWDLLLKTLAKIWYQNGRAGANRELSNAEE